MVDIFFQNSLTAGVWESAIFKLSLSQVRGEKNGDNLYLTVKEIVKGLLKTENDDVSRGSEHQRFQKRKTIYFC